MAKKGAIDFQSFLLKLKAEKIIDDIGKLTAEERVILKDAFSKGKQFLKEDSQLFSGSSRYLDGVTNPGEMLLGFDVPKYYTYSKDGIDIFISPHAMKHLEEIVAHGAGNPFYLRILGQTHQRSLHAAIDDVLARGPINYREMYFSSGHEIMFGAPRIVGDLPAVIHFR